MDFPATQPLCSNDKGYVFITRSSAYDEAEQYLWMDKESGEVRNLFQQKTDPSVTVRSACLTEDTLYFLHSDGALYRFALEGSSEPEKTQLPWLALAFALHGEDILLAVRVPNGQIVETGLILLKPDGERVTLKEGGAPFVSTPAACRLAVSEKGWLLAVAGEEECVYGNWDE